MYSFNGTCYPSLSKLPENLHRSIWNGPVAKDQWRIEQGKILFFETSYFNLMAQLRRLRVEVAMNFTMEHLEQHIQALLANAPKANAYLLNLHFYRREVITETQPISPVNYGMELFPQTDRLVETPQQFQHLELYKDYFVAKDSSSGLFSSQDRYIAWAKIFAFENDFTDCLLLNTQKEIIGSAKGNLYALNGTLIQIPIIEETTTNALNIAFNSWLLKHKEYQLTEVAFSPFELQKMEELSVLSMAAGLQAVSSYRKTTYKTSVFPQLFQAFLKQI